MKTTYIVAAIVFIGLLLVFYYQKRTGKLALFSGTKKNKPRRGAPTPVLDTYSRDLTALAAEGLIDPVIGREEEIERTIEILSRRTKDNPILIGEPGVGKTAIVEGLARRIAADTIPPILKHKRVIALDLSGLISGTKYRGEFEERLNKIMREILLANREIILFIDEVHVITQTKGAEGAIDASNILKPALARGELQAIGATTLSEYKDYIEKDESLNRRFQPIIVNEPTTDQAIQIVEGLRPTYEKHHQVVITPEALRAAVILSKEYIPHRYLPDKAIDLIDEGSAKVRIETSEAPGKIKELAGKLETMEKKLQSAQDPGAAASLRKEIDMSRSHMVQLETLFENDTKRGVKPQLTVNDIKRIISMWTGKDINQIKE